MVCRAKPNVALYVYGDSLAAEDVTNALGIEPTKIRKKGEQFSKSSDGKTIAAKTGLWMRRTSTSSTKLNDHIDEIIGYLEVLGDQKTLSNIAGVNSTKVDVYILEPAGKEIGVSVTSERLAKLGMRGLNFDITFGYLPALED